MEFLIHSFCEEGKHFKAKNHWKFDNEELKRVYSQRAKPYYFQTCHHEPAIPELHLYPADMALTLAGKNLCFFLFFFATTETTCGFILLNLSSWYTIFVDIFEAQTMTCTSAG